MQAAQKKMMTAVFAVSLLTFDAAAQQQARNKTTQKDLHVFAPQTGNPVIPAYLADASIFYDKQTATFYAYGTNDGAGGGNVYPTQMWHSKDCRQWKNELVLFPKSWTDSAGTSAVWAPSIAYNPGTKKYYLMYGIASKTFVAMSHSPMGPWEDANGAAPGRLLYKGYDGQFFVDNDGQMYIVTDAHQFKIFKLKFDDKGKIYFHNNDPLFAKKGYNEAVGNHRFAQTEELRNTFEASFIYKRKGLYYLMWSFEGSENYNVRYAVSEKITGPYREINQSMTVPILQRNIASHILGPGHHSLFDYNGRTFIAYHRQHYPFVDSKRQTCIDEVFFAEDGSIQNIKPTHRGVTVVKNAIAKAPVNIAFGKKTMTSSDRAYDSSGRARRYRTYGISFRYTGNYAVDENYGTRWDAGVDAKNPWLMVDLGKEAAIDSIETMFEFTSRTYRYKLEYLSGQDAGTLNAASKAAAWQMLSDKTVDGAPKSPVVDKPSDNTSVKGRFVRLTITDAINLPLFADEWGDKVNSANALSVFELKVYGR